MAQRQRRRSSAGLRQPLQMETGTLDGSTRRGGLSCGSWPWRCGWITTADRWGKASSRLRRARLPNRLLKKLAATNPIALIWGEVGIL